jgi:hypothetical protein
VVDRPSFSFNAYLANQPSGPTEVHTWTADIYAQLRDFELRLLMAKLKSRLGGTPTPAPEPERQGRVRG